MAGDMGDTRRVAGAGDAVEAVAVTDFVTDLVAVSVCAWESFKWPMKEFNNPEIPTAPNMQAAGANVSIKRTMTPAKYQAMVPYKIKNNFPSVKFWNKKNKPTGAKGTATCRSKKKDVHAVGWCSDTEAMMGMYFLA